jgi:UDP-N-acetylmuramoylalanine--D-glutamate ligase
MELRGKCVMVVGLGISGMAVARFLASQGSSLILTDTRRVIPSEDFRDVKLYLGGENPLWVRGVDLVVVSPGVPSTSRLLQTARAAGIPVIGELELASRHLDCPIAAVTGTNGKSTVTTLLGIICARGGLKTFVGGNLGTPLIEAIGRGYRLAVVEVSSFQLETIEFFRPRVAIHLNLSEDHLDRYDDLEGYGRAKARIFENQASADWAILNRDDPRVWPLHTKVRSRVFSFGVEKPRSVPEGAIWDDRGALHFRLDQLEGAIRLDGFPLPGRFNRANAMAAAAAALALKIETNVIDTALAEARSLPHRLEFVREKDRVTFVDDSKGTNVGAVVEAIGAVAAPIILIAGGVDKGGSYAALREPLRQRVKLLLLYGEARDVMHSALSGTTRIECVQTLEQAVKMAAAEARPQDTVLLSPACASFDQFKNYADRGQVFQKLVRAL